LQWLARFSRRREEKEGGREKPPARAPSHAVFAHIPHHRDGSGEAHRMPPWKMTFDAVWVKHAPSKRHGWCPQARANNFLFYIHTHTLNYPDPT